MPHFFLQPRRGWTTDSFPSLQHVIGEDKIIRRVKKPKMAFNAQFPNNTRIEHRDWQAPRVLEDTFLYGSHAARVKASTTPHKSVFNYANKLSQITPSLCFQADVFFPNAVAGVKAALDLVDPDRDRNPLEAEGGRGFTTAGPHATGCRGNQVQGDFPLLAKVPVTLPIVQYPSIDVNCDVCAVPVLNWEKYVERFKSTIDRTRWWDPRNRRSGKKGEKKKAPEQGQGLSSPTTVHVYRDGDPCSDSDGDAENNNDKEAEGNCSDDLFSEGSDEEVVQCQQKKQKEKRTLLSQLRLSSSSRGVKQYMTPYQKTALLIEKDRREKNLKLPGRRPDQDRKTKTNKNRKAKKSQQSARVPEHDLSVYKSIPGWKIESTWNYFYGGSTGACCKIVKNDEIQLFTANQTQLRQVVLENAPSTSMLSYRVQSVWEENVENVPHQPGKDGNCDVQSKLVYQTVMPAGNFNLLGARRGKTVDIYSIEEDVPPYLLHSIQIVAASKFYRSKNYSKSQPYIEDPLLLGLDFNPLFSGEFITIDENAQIMIYDVTSSSVSQHFGITKPLRRSANYPEIPKFNYVNDACGVQFTQYEDLFYAWSGSKVHLGDRRVTTKQALTELFDLRHGVASLSSSDQFVFNASNLELNEWICSLKPSKKDYYYYVGSSSRLFLFDVRVPNQPVLKVEHGADNSSYLDTCMTQDHEMVVGGSQRNGLPFGIITDHSHAKCFDRPHCAASNPILHSLPRHFSSSREFLGAVGNAGYDFAWETDHENARKRQYAWMTGLSVLPIKWRIHDGREPAGIALFNTNCYGDVFYQEWGHFTADNYRRYDIEDYEFKEFAKAWHTSMSSNKLDFAKPITHSQAIHDFSFLVETSARESIQMPTIRQEPFDAKTVNEIVHNQALDSEQPISVRLQKLRKYKAEVAQRCLDFWDDSTRTEEPDIKQEPISDAESEETAGSSVQLMFGNETETLVIKQEPISDGESEDTAGSSVQLMFDFGIETLQQDDPAIGTDDMNEFII